MVLRSCPCCARARLSETIEGSSEGGFCLASVIMSLYRSARSRAS